MSISERDFNAVAAAKPKKKREAPFSLRLTFKEKAALRKLAGKMPLGAFIKAVLKEVVQQGKTVTPPPDSEALGRVLGQLGQSRLSSNVNQLAKAVNQGTLPVTPETEAEIKEACRAIAEMRDELMRALKPGGAS